MEGRKEVVDTSEEDRARDGGRDDDEDEGEDEGAKFELEEVKVLDVKEVNEIEVEELFTEEERGRPCVVAEDNVGLLLFSPGELVAVICGRHENAIASEAKRLRRTYAVSAHQNTL